MGNEGNNRNGPAVEELRCRQPEVERGLHRCSWTGGADLKAHGSTS